MFYQPPNKWTEDQVDDLPFGEDNRYERKSGQQLEKGETEFFNGIAKEIGAFANSFGGTLFIGVTDANEKVGIPKIAKGRTPTERWLENKIPTLFELRLQNFKVSIVELSTDTQSRIGADRCIVGIDILDSDLAPHQCVFDHRYYYRLNSSSVPAPHHYLAFLWTRTSSNMSQVATWWLRDFLSPLIDLLESIRVFFDVKLFNISANRIYDYGPFKYEIDFCKWIEWQRLTRTAVAEFFLSTFPVTKGQLDQFNWKTLSFEKTIRKLQNALSESPVFLDQVKDVYERMGSRHGLGRSEYEQDNIEQIISRVLGQLGLQMSNQPVEAKENLIRFISYALLEIDFMMPTHAVREDDQLTSLAKELSKEISTADAALNDLTQQCKKLYEEIKNESASLLAELKRDRIDIGRRYAAAEW